MTENANDTKLSLTEDINGEVAVYRLMASADAFFTKKCYSEAYNGYDSVLDADFSCLKAYFRREITSRYLMMETSSAYLGCGGFFTEMEEIGKRISDTDDEKLSTAICGDMLDFISARAEYEKK